MVCSSSAVPDKRRNLKPQVWGKNAWMFLYSVALGYPNDPTNAEKRAAKQMVESLQYMLPCHACRDNFVREIDAAPIDDALKCSDSFVEYLCKLENSVSARTGGPQRTCAQSVSRLFEAPPRKNGGQYWHLVWIVLLVAAVSVICTWAITRTVLMNNKRPRVPQAPSQVMFLPSRM